MSHAERALKSALFVCIVAQRFDEWLKRRFPDKALPDFAVGVGVHTGAVMVCRINTGAGVDTTIIGDTVNVASRLEAMTRQHGAGILMSRSAVEAAERPCALPPEIKARLRDLGPMAIVGHDAPVHLFAIAREQKT